VRTDTHASTPPFSFLQAGCPTNSVKALIIINIFVWRHKVVTSEALGPGSVLLRKGREKAREKRNVFSLDLNTVTESLLTIVFGSKFQTAGAEHR